MHVERVVRAMRRVIVSSVFEYTAATDCVGKVLAKLVGRRVLGSADGQFG